jgi:hypothetical protein
VIEPRDLLRPQESDLAVFPNVAKVRATGILLKRRSILIRQIIAERETVLDEERRSESSRLSVTDSRPDDVAVLEAAIERIERMQQWEVEQLVREQTRRKSGRGARCIRGS